MGDITSMTREEEIEAFVQEYGVQWRRMIQDALAFLDERGPTWHLREPIDRKEYIRDLMTRARSDQWTDH